VRKIIVIFALLFIVATTTYAFSPMGYPWFTWGDLSYQTGGEEDGFKGDGYIEQGIDWFPILGWTANTFVGIHGVASDNSDQYWNNKFGIMPGVKFRRNFNFGQSTALELAVGYRWEYYAYFDGHDSSRGIGFGNWYIGGNWDDNRWSWHSWGEISNGAGDPDNSFKVDMYVQQGFKATTLGKWAVVPYAGFRVVQSDHSNYYWNNKVGPRLGLEFQRPVGTGAIALGVRGDYYLYNSGDVDDEVFATIYMTWWFSGDHKKDREVK